MSTLHLDSQAHPNNLHIPQLSINLCPRQVLNRLDPPREELEHNLNQLIPIQFNQTTSTQDPPSKVDKDNQNLL